MDKTIAGLVVQVFRSVDLHDPAHITNHHPVGDCHRFRLVMGHEDDGEIELALQRLDLKAHGFTQLRIEVGQRFVQKHDLGIGNDGTGQRNTLLLTA